MTEMWAALVGAVVGAVVRGLLSAWVGSKQTARVLKHEIEREGVPPFVAT